MPDDSPDLHTLLARLRDASAAHTDPRLPVDVPARAWVATPATPSTSNPLQSALLGGPATVGSLAPFLVIDDDSFVHLAYLRLLGRPADPEGRNFMLQRLGLRTPRTELMAEMILSAEARERRFGGTAKRLLARLLHLAVHPPFLRTERVGRAVLRRLEARLARRAHRSAFGVAWQLARAQDAGAVHVHTVLAQVQEAQTHRTTQQAVLKKEQADLRHQLAEQEAVQGRQQASLTDLRHQLVQQKAVQGTYQASLTDLHHQLVQQAAVQGTQQATLADLTDSFATLERAVVERTAAQAALTEAQSRLSAVQAELAQAVSAQDRRLTDHFVTLQLANVQQLPMAPADRTAVADFFAAFEAHFRGDPAALREQLAQDYLGRLFELRETLPAAPCLDLGCGRGVWLGLLRDHGFPAQGVDLNVQAVADAQQQGLDAQVRDALQWLRSMPDSSALAITAFHLMEHLPFSVRLALVAQCARVLVPGGLLMLETPNPENIWVATHTFYHDPTHSQPLTPDSLAYLVNYHGLETVEVARLHPYPESARLPEVDAVTSRLNNMTCAGQDFAVIARKPR
jgi:SAM-dependent methyltransferase